MNPVRALSNQCQAFGYGRYLTIVLGAVLVTRVVWA